MIRSEPAAPRRRLRLFRRPSAPPRPSAPRPERRDCQSRLVAQLLAALGEGWTLSEASFRPWCSATFIGAQHRLTLSLAADNAIDRALGESERLPDLEFRIAGHIVADLAIEALREIAPGTACIELAILTVEDW